MARKPGQKKQTEIEGTERYHDDEISAAIESLQEAHKAKASATAASDAARAHLTALMIEKGLVEKEYVDPELKAKVIVTRKERLSLKKIKVEDDEDGDEEE